MNFVLLCFLSDMSESTFSKLQQVLEAAYDESVAEIAKLTKSTAEIRGHISMFKSAEQEMEKDLKRRNLNRQELDRKAQEAERLNENSKRLSSQCSKLLEEASGIMEESELGRKDSRKSLDGRNKSSENRIAIPSVPSESEDEKLKRLHARACADYIKLKKVLIKSREKCFYGKLLGDSGAKSKVLDQWALSRVGVDEKRHEANESPSEKPYLELADELLSVIEDYFAALKGRQIDRDILQALQIVYFVLGAKHIPSFWVAEGHFD